ncbi:MAG TPA: 4-hydroxy-tetrahydrodipicolinate synthase [Myxococcota bacterium]
MSRTVNASSLRGVWTALVTPFTADDHVDVDALRALVREQLAAGVTGLVPCGTTGETATMSVAEQDLVITTVLDEVKGKVLVVAGAGANDTKKAIERHQQVAALRAGDFVVDGALHVTPWYNKPTQDGLIAHFMAVVASSPLPIVLYNVPGRTGVDMLPDTVLKLVVADKRFVAIKEATGSVQRSQDLLNALHAAGKADDVAVLSGDDGHILSLLAIGGHGVISVTSHLCAKELVQMVQAFDAGNIAEAQRLSRQTSPLSNHMFFRSNPIPVKTALALRQQANIAARFRLPLVPLAAKELEELQQRLSSSGWL